jgi:hypothetical protein
LSRKRSECQNGGGGRTHWHGATKCHGMSRYGGEWKTSLQFCFTSLGANPLPDGIAIDSSFSRPHARPFSQHASARGALPDRLAPAVVFVPIPRLDCRSALDEQTLHTQGSILFWSPPARADKPPRPEVASCSMRLSLRFCSCASSAKRVLRLFKGSFPGRV